MYSFSTIPNAIRAAGIVMPARPECVVAKPETGHGQADTVGTGRRKE